MYGNRQPPLGRLRRASFPFYFSLEILSGGVPPTIAVIAVALIGDLPLLPPLIAFLGIWYGAEWLLAAKAGWHHSWRSIATCMLRDLMLPVLYVNAWLGRGFEWRGNDMRAVESARLS